MNTTANAVTLLEAARQTHTNYQTLRYWMRGANLPTTRLGNYRLVDLDAVRRLVESKKK